VGRVMPGTGSLVAAVQVASGVQPVSDSLLACRRRRLGSALLTPAAVWCPLPMPATCA
jgi:hypothetical protein